LAERTVKFHVSALLQKFHVADRVSLMQKAASMLSGERDPLDGTRSHSAGLMPANPDSGGNSLRPKLLRLTASERRAR
jgi:Bacterial regulatory proteins, luxR family